MRKFLYSMLVAGVLMFAATGCDNDPEVDDPKNPGQEEPGGDEPGGEEPGGEEPGEKVAVLTFYTSTVCPHEVSDWTTVTWTKVAAPDYVDMTWNDAENIYEGSLKLETENYEGELKLETPEWLKATAVAGAAGVYVLSTEGLSLEGASGVLKVAKADGTAFGEMTVAAGVTPHTIAAFAGVMGAPEWGEWTDDNGNLVFEQSATKEVTMIGDTDMYQQYIKFETRNLEGVDVKVDGIPEWLNITKQTGYDNVAHLMAMDMPLEGGECTLKFICENGEVITEIKVVAPAKEAPFNVVFNGNSSIKVWHFESNGYYNATGDIEKPEYKEGPVYVTIDAAVDGDKRPTWYFFETDANGKASKPANAWLVINDLSTRSHEERIYLEVSALTNTANTARTGVAVFLPFNSTASEADVMANYANYTHFNVVQNAYSDIPVVSIWNIENWNENDKLTTYTPENWESWPKSTKYFYLLNYAAATESHTDEIYDWLPDGGYGPTGEYETTYFPYSLAFTFDLAKYEVYDDRANGAMPYYTWTKDAQTGADKLDWLWMQQTASDNFKWWGVIMKATEAEFGFIALYDDADSDVPVAVIKCVCGGEQGEEPEQPEIPDGPAFSLENPSSSQKLEEVTNAQSWEWGSCQNYFDLTDSELTIDSWHAPLTVNFPYAKMEMYSSRADEAMPYYTWTLMTEEGNMDWITTSGMGTGELNVGITGKSTLTEYEDGLGYILFYTKADDMQPYAVLRVNFTGDYPSTEVEVRYPRVSFFFMNPDSVTVEDNVATVKAQINFIMSADDEKTRAENAPAKVYIYAPAANGSVPTERTVLDAVEAGTSSDLTVATLESGLWFFKIGNCTEAHYVLCVAEDAEGNIGQVISLADLSEGNNGFNFSKTWKFEDPNAGGNEDVFTQKVEGAASEWIKFTNLSDSNHKATIESTATYNAKYMYIIGIKGNGNTWWQKSDVEKKFPQMMSNAFSQYSDGGIDAVVAALKTATGVTGVTMDYEGAPGAVSLPNMNVYWDYGYGPTYVVVLVDNDGGLTFKAAGYVDYGASIILDFTDKL